MMIQLSLLPIKNLVIAIVKVMPRVLSGRAMFDLIGAYKSEGLSETLSRIDIV